MAKVVLNQSALNKINRDIATALEMTGDYVLDELVEKQVIPFDKGTLQNDGTFVDKSLSSQGIVRIVSSTPYARRLYYHPEYNFQTANNANAGAYWLEEWGQNGKYAKDVQKAYEHFFKQIGGF